MAGEPIGKCYKCGANLYATLGLCLSCENDELQAENKRLKQGIIDDKDVEVVLVPRKIYDRIQKQAKELR